MDDGNTSEGSTSSIKTFTFSSTQEPRDAITVTIPEQLHASYGMYTWPCAPVLGWYIWSHRHSLVGKHVLELGAGTSLPGIVAAKCGANVTLSDCARFTRCLGNCKQSAAANNVSEKVEVVGLTWGLFEPQLFRIKPVHLILGSDCFYDPAVFEPILVTVAFLLEKNPSARFVCSYKERSTDWSLEPLLSKWKLSLEILNTADYIPADSVDIAELTQDFTIQLFEIKQA